MSIEQEYKYLSTKVVIDIEFILAYALGCRLELQMNELDSYRESLRVYIKMEHGFVEPFKVNVMKYKNILNEIL